jgi:hypothetical protein
MPRVRLLCVDDQREKCCVDPRDDKSWRPVRDRANASRYGEISRHVPPCQIPHRFPAFS